MYIAMTNTQRRLNIILTGNMQYIQDIRNYTQPSQARCHRALELSDRSSDITAPSPHAGVNWKRRTLVRLTATNSIPDSGKSDTSHEDDRSVVHVVESDGESGGHAEERDSEADPS
jgi:hypothetical protein